MRAWDVKEAEEEEAPAEPSLLPAADVKEPVALAPEQALKPAQRMCKFLALRLAFGNPSGSDLHKAALSGSSGSSSSAERVSLATKKMLNHTSSSRSAPCLARALHILVSQRRKRCHRVPQIRWSNQASRSPGRSPVTPRQKITQTIN